MPTQYDLWGKASPDHWVVFHDESYCRSANFLYHGFLIVRIKEGPSIQQLLLQPDPSKPYRQKRVHFTDIRGFGTEQAEIARQWVILAKEKWLCEAALKFYVFGVNLANINPQLYSKFSSDKVYQRFYEIGLNGTLRWFGIAPEQVTHLYYDQGKLDIERYHRSLSICGHDTVVRPLHNDCAASGQLLSKFLQLTDVLLGTVRTSFTAISPGNRGQRACVEIFDEVVTRFNNEKSAYNPKSKYWKRFCMNFFPSRNDMTRKSFQQKTWHITKKPKGCFTAAG